MITITSNARNMAGHQKAAPYEILMTRDKTGSPMQLICPLWFDGKCSFTYYYTNIKQYAPIFIPVTEREV